jgi:hypothetical protein
MAKADYCCCDDCDCKVVYAPDHDYEFSGPIGVFCAECHKARGDAYEKLKAENERLKLLRRAALSTMYWLRAQGIGELHAQALEAAFAEAKP